MYRNEMSNVNREIMEHMNEFLEVAEPSVLKKFITFGTGAPSLPGCQEFPQWHPFLFQQDDAIFVDILENHPASLIFRIL